jgi:lycopene cyclase domain-containing protein
VTARLTYFGFHAVFILPALAVLGLVVYRRRDRIAARDWRFRLVGTTVLAAIALVYTTPWDNYLISRGVWWYGDGAVAATVWLAPVEEYVFILLQPLVVACWLFLLPSPSTDAVEVSVRQRLWGVLAGVAVGVVGGVLLALGGGTYYLGAILAWAAPVFALQWGFGWPYLWAVRRTFALAVAVPTLYLWVADWFAIWLDIWYISPAHTTGVSLLGLPIEEATFFLVTNLFVVQGLLLFLWVVDRWR